MLSICKFLFIVSAIISSQFYSLSFRTPDGNVVPLTNYSNHKTIIVFFNPLSGDYRQLKMLASILLDSPQVKIIAVPANEFSTTGTTTQIPSIPDSVLSTLRDSLALSLTMTSAMYVQKRDSSQQTPFSSWLTHVDQNRHFDRDVEAEGQLYLINEKGVLYAIMPKGVSKATIEQHLNVVINE